MDISHAAILTEHVIYLDEKIKHHGSDIRVLEMRMHQKVRDIGGWGHQSDTKDEFFVGGNDRKFWVLQVFHYYAKN